MSASPLTLNQGDIHGNLSAIIDALATGEGDLVVIAGDLVIAPDVLAPITSQESAGTVIATRPARGGNLRVRHHQVVAAATSFHSVHSGNARSVGALRIAVADQAASLTALHELREALDRGAITLEPAESVEAVATALIRAQIPLKAIDLIDVPWFRLPAGSSAAEVESARTHALAITPERIARLQANRVDDGFYSTFVVRKLSKPLTGLALRLRLSPNSITMISFVIGLGAALSFAQGQRWALILGALALQLSLIIDCVDGEVARATKRFSPLGAWLDASTDRVKEYAVYAGLAAGAVVMGVDSTLVWSLAVVTMIVQTARHMGDYTFAFVQKHREANLPPAAITDPGDPWGEGGGALDRSAAANSRTFIRWAKKVIHMPIGERWLVLSVVAALVNGYWALLVLLTLTSLAWIYTLAGRIVRTLSWKGLMDTGAAEPGSAQVMVVANQIDAGPLLGFAITRTGWQPRSRWAWSYSMLLRLGEMSLVAVIAYTAFPQWIALSFGYLFIIAFHHYDNLYRALAGTRAPRWITYSALGFDGRSLIVVIAAFFGITAFHDALNLGVAWLFMWCVVIASAQYLSVQMKKPVL